jgi:hypothetical protein
MPQFLPVGAGRYSHRFSLAGSSEVIVVTGGVLLEAGVSDVQGAADALHLAMVTFWQAVGTTNIVLEETTLAARLTAGGELIVAQKLLTAGGINAPPILPSNSTFLIKKRTVEGGRANRGRWYLPGVREGSVDDLGTIAAATVANMTTRAEDYRTTVAGSPLIAGLALLHSPRPLVLQPPPTIITQMVCDSKIATQRRRLR